MILMVTNFGPVTTLSFKDGTCDGSDGSEMEPGLEMELVTSLMVKDFGPVTSLEFRYGTCDEFDDDGVRCSDESQVQR